MLDEDDLIWELEWEGEMWIGEQKERSVGSRVER